jgi:hypothetical protein
MVIFYENASRNFFKTKEKKSEKQIVNLAPAAAALEVSYRDKVHILPAAGINNHFFA